MRPGSPVRPMSIPPPGPVQGRPAPPLPVAPTVVWVAVAVFTTAVRVNRQVADQPLAGGRNAIFNQGQVEDRLNCVVLGVRADRSDAEGLVEKHRANHPDLKADYQVTEHLLADDRPVEQEPSVLMAHACIDCGTGISPNLTRCKPCQDRFWQSCRSADPDWANE